MRDPGQHWSSTGGVGGILLEIDDEWQVERRYFSQESMRKLTEPPTDPVAPSSPLRLAPVRKRKENGWQP